MYLPGPLSALDPAGMAAERIATLFWWMAGGALLIWFAMAGLILYVSRVSPEAHRPRTGNALIIGGGIIFPTVTLTVVLTYGLSILPGLLAPAPEGSLELAVTGYQWWWRVRYPLEDGGSVELANEIALPAGEHVTFRLDSGDVIHAFWIPALGGKVDMIPGRNTRLTLEPRKEGVYRGACAEYCGGSHALMNLDVHVMNRAAFDDWLENQKQPAANPQDPEARRGLTVFLRHGCGACHSIRGTEADGVIGPDLTHFGSRSTLGAGLLPNNAESRKRWLIETATLKPGVHMPAFGMLEQEDLNALAKYLGALK